MIKIPLSTISKIVQKLSSEEINTLSIQLKVYTDKRWDLYKLIKGNPNISNEEACLSLYKSSQSKAYNQLKQNLKNDLLNTLLLFYSKKTLKTKNTQIAVDTKRLILVSDILFIENLDHEGVKVLKQVIKIIETYEYYHISAQVLYKLLYSTRDTINIVEFEKYAKLLELHTTLNNYQTKALIIYNRLFKNVRKKGSVSQFIADGTIAVKKLEELYAKSNLASIGSEYYRTKINIELQESNFIEALQSCQKYLTLVKKSPYLNNNANIGGISMLLSNTHLRQSNYKDSQYYAQKAIENFSTKSNNQIVARRMLFYALFYQKGQENEIYQLIKKTEKHPVLRKSIFLQSKWKFFHINVLFKEKKYNEVLDAVFDLKDLEMDKEGWLAHIRVLEIICLLEKEDYKYVDYRIEGFRAALYRNKIHTNKRLMKIYRVFKIIISSIYNPKDEKVRLYRIARQLETDQDKLKWNISEAEVNPFHQWLKDYIPRRKAKKRMS